jgi:hypothetical protein
VQVQQVCTLRSLVERSRNQARLAQRVQSQRARES